MKQAWMRSGERWGRMCPRWAAAYLYPKRPLHLVFTVNMHPFSRERMK